MKYRTIEEAGLWRSYEAGRVITRGGQSSPLLRMPMAVEVKQLGDKNSRVLRFVASTEDEDRDGDIIRIAGWELANFLTNPAHLWAHNMREDLPPIGKTIRIELQETRMINDVDFFMAEEFELARLAFKAHLAGVCAESVGFRPLEAAERHGSDGRLMGFEFKRQELLEISSVPVPSNPNALMMATQKGLLTSEEATTIEKVWTPERTRPIEIYLPETKEAPLKEAASQDPASADSVCKAVVPHKEYPLAPIERDWDAEAVVGRLIRFVGGPDKEQMDFEAFRNFFTLWDPETPTSLTGYRLPHHDILDGKPHTVFRGVLAAIAAINGARGGVDASEEEKQRTYAHLAKHMREFDREPPPLKAAAAGLVEAERKAWQEYYLLMAEAHGLKITIETGEAGEGEAKQVEVLAQTVQALSQRWEQREQTIGRAVSQAVQDAVKAL